MEHDSKIWPKGSAFAPPPGLEIPSGFGYIRAKAHTYLKTGPETYRKIDFFHLPPVDWSPELLETVRNGCEQLVRWRGVTPDAPLEDLGIEGFYCLLQLFHFEVDSQASMPGKDRAILDRMQMRHVVTGEEVVLHNLVKQTP